MGRKRRLGKLGELQLAILQVLWEHGPCSVADIHRRLRGRKLAYTTVATMLRKMEARGLVHHTVEDRRFIYHAAVDAEQARRSAVQDLVRRYFQGDVTAAVCNLLDIADVTPEELKELEELIARYRRRSSQESEDESGA